MDGTAGVEAMRDMVIRAEAATAAIPPEAVDISAPARALASAAVPVAVGIPPLAVDRVVVVAPPVIRAAVMGAVAGLANRDSTATDVSA
jgi:hypothetical protein